MSGIFGLIYTEGKPSLQTRLEAMLSALSRRGPDNAGLWHSNTVGLGHRMLCTTPEAHFESLPFHDIPSGCIITSDARVDNRDDLIHSLGKNVFKTDVIPDSIILLQAYLKWGESCVNHILGDFAFGIWDTRKRQLFCARDHLGIKPFTYCYQKDSFVFCSEARVIADHSGLQL